MKRTSLVVLIVCACFFVSVAWGQQPTDQVYQQLERVPQNQHAALESV